jgi:hypothetical protein
MTQAWALNCSTKSHRIPAAEPVEVVVEVLSLEVAPALARVVQQSPNRPSPAAGVVCRWARL